MLTKKSVPLKNVKSFDKVRQPLTIFKNNLNCVASTNDSFNNVPNFSFSWISFSISLFNSWSFNFAALSWFFSLELMKEETFGEVD